jgi:hypothetical protein
MALVRKNVSYNKYNLGGLTTATLSHNHPTGSDWIYVILAIDSYSSVSGVTFGGTAMTLHSSNSAYYGGIWNVYKLNASALTGTRDIVVSGLQSYDYVSVAAYSFSGADGIGNVTFNNTPATGTDDKTASITVSNNSMIIANGWNGASSPGTYWVEVPDGTTISTNYANLMYTFTWGGCSPSKSAGTYSCAVNQNVTYAAIILLIEIKEGVSIVAPTVTTNTPITSITQTTASGGGNVTSDGGASVTARGVCWSTSTNPTTANSKTTDGSGTGSFTSSLTGLSANTLYYVRAYATNSVGTSYGANVTFTTLSATTRRIFIV